MRQGGTASVGSGSTGDALDDTTVEAVVARVSRRLLPLLILLYLVAYIDRQNVAFAKLEMLRTLPISEVAYGFGASLFFIGYLLLEVPSSLALRRYGARRWIARIMLTWGLVTLALAFTRSATMFCVLRLLLGAAEAGLYPGLIYTLTIWFPERYRVRVVGTFTLGSCLGNMLGAPLNGMLLSMDHVLGLAGWQWVFLLTGTAPVLLAFVTLRLLPDGPEQAWFLSAAERATLVAAVRVGDRPEPAGTSPLGVLRQPRILVLSGFYMMISMSIYGVTYWLPTVVRGFGVGYRVNGLLNMVPWTVAALMLLWLPSRLRNPDVTLRCAGLAACLGILCFCAAALVAQPALRLAALSLGAPCLYVMIPCFWWLPAHLLGPRQAATGIAAINALANLGGFFGQNAMPWVQAITGRPGAPLLVPAACLAVLGVGSLVGRRLLQRGAF